MGLWRRIMFGNREVPNVIFTKSHLWSRMKPVAWGMAPRSQTVDFWRFEGTVLPSQTCRPLKIKVLCFFGNLGNWLPSDLASYSVSHRWRPESSTAWLLELEAFDLFRLQICLPLAFDGKAKLSFQRFHFFLYFLATCNLAVLKCFSWNIWPDPPTHSFTGVRQHWTDYQ